MHLDSLKVWRYARKTERAQDSNEAFDYAQRIKQKDEGFSYGKYNDDKLILHSCMPKEDTWVWSFRRAKENPDQEPGFSPERTIKAHLLSLKTVSAEIIYDNLVARFNAANKELTVCMHAPVHQLKKHELHTIECNIDIGNKLIANALNAFSEQILAKMPIEELKDFHDYLDNLKPSVINLTDCFHHSLKAKVEQLIINKIVEEPANAKIFSLSK